ncbi:hypothetical protein B0H13DRAFT_1916521 [Mycena leptocephala]|nr:hypothetical protein B0H13DRAFT_1916521 [Mycena leptocephala]
MRFYLPLLALALTFLIGTNAIPTAESNHAARDLNMAMDGTPPRWGRALLHRFRYASPVLLPLCNPWQRRNGVRGVLRLAQLCCSFEVKLKVQWLAFKVTPRWSLLVLLVVLLVVFLFATRREGVQVGLNQELHVLLFDKISPFGFHFALLVDFWLCFRPGTFSYLLPVFSFSADFGSDPCQKLQKGSKQEVNQEDKKCKDIGLVVDGPHLQYMRACKLEGYRLGGGWYTPTLHATMLDCICGTSPFDSGLSYMLKCFVFSVTYSSPQLSSRLNKACLLELELVLPSILHIALPQPLHFGGFSNQGCAEVPRQTWTHLGLGRPLPSFTRGLPGIKSCYGAAFKT